MFELFAPDIDLRERGLRMNVFLLPHRQIVDDRHCVSFVDQRIGNMRSDKSRAAGYENVHFFFLL